ncbi:hypothetical protein DPMN_088323 [Dreissena polymorpha]|uniref:Uncharacterized protein n=1 Tax=Dreissena polymorpha TaxID=45954 RepID=A0A9D4KVN5_DREPO|nr:hypothetical protein DPMN_088323 [Dreissena polymorpha]
MRWYLPEQVKFKVMQGIPTQLHRLVGPQREHGVDVRHSDVLVVYIQQETAQPWTNTDKPGGTGVEFN